MPLEARGPDAQACMQEYKQRLVKAKKYIQNLKQQAVDATAAKEQVAGELQAVQQQLQENSSSTAAAAGTEAEAGSAQADSVSKAEYDQLKVRIPDLTADKHV